MDIFDQLKNLYTHKREGNYEDYVPFLVQRWVSFTSPDVAQVLNLANTGAFLENKDMHWKLLSKILPKLSRAPRFRYIKGTKKTKPAKTKTDVQFLAQQMELSVREVELMLAQID